METIRLRELINAMGGPAMGKAHNLEEMWRLSRGGILLIDSDTYLRDYENNLWINPTRQRFGPEYPIYGRCYWNSGWADPMRSERWNTVSPAVKAAEIVRRCSLHGHDLLRDPHFVLQIDNENDLAYEGHPEAALGPWGNDIAVKVYDQIFNDQCETLRCLDELVPDRVCGVTLGNLAGGHNALVEPGDVHPVSGLKVTVGTRLPPDYEYQLASFKRLLKYALSRQMLVDGVIYRRVFIGVHCYIHRDGHGWSPDTDGYWHALRPLRPVGYREAVQGLTPDDAAPNFVGTSDPGGVCEQYPNVPVVVTEQNFWHCPEAVHDDNWARMGANKFEAVLSFYQRDPLQRIKKVFYFIWNSYEGHAENVICPSNQPVSKLVHRMLETPAYYSDREYAVGTEAEGGTVVEDQVRDWLKDMWKRQGITPNEGNDAFFDYALKEARKGRVIVPQASKDGNYYNVSGDYLLAYTLPVPLWCKVGEWVVSEGFPPF